MEVRCLGCVSLPQHACSIETRPADRTVVACGLYELDEGAGRRSGGVAFFAVAEDEDGQARIQELPSHSYSSGDAGILDMKWSSGEQSRHLVSATSTGSLVLIAYEPLSLRVVQHTQPEQDCLYLSVDWDNRVDAAPDAHVFTSTSEGDIVVFRLTDTGLEPCSRWPAHSLYSCKIEAWIVAADPHSKNLIVSGGDDSLLKLWDLRQQRSTACTSWHTGGVTTAQWHPTKEHTFISGSYDERIAIWDSRTLVEPVSTVNVGGGVWRAKWCPLVDAAEKDSVLVAGMRGGCVLLHTRGTIEEGARYTGHPSEALAYGIDWVGVDAEARARVASCSFYDNQLHLWETTGRVSSP